jgi:predicted esterase/predicted nucleic-acid-binding Zn-ribbon protein
MSNTIFILIYFSFFIFNTSYAQKIVRCDELKPDSIFYQSARVDEKNNCKKIGNRDYFTQKIISIEEDKLLVKNLDNDRNFYMKINQACGYSTKTEAEQLTKKNQDECLLKLNAFESNNTLKQKYYENLKQEEIAIERENFKSFDFNGQKIFYSFPQKAKGIIYLFHGNYGNGRNWFSNELLMFTNQLRSTYGIIAYSNQNAQENDAVNWDEKHPRNWDRTEAENNRDIVFYNALENEFMKKFPEISQLPRYAVGYSDGAWFTSLLSTYVQLNAIANFSCGMSHTVMRNEKFSVPILLYYGSNDVTCGSVSSMRMVVENLKQKGISINYIEQKETKLTSTHLKNIPNMNTLDAEYLIKSLRDLKFDYSNWSQTYLGVINSLDTDRKKYSAIVTERLRAIGGHHQLNSDYAGEVIRWFNTYK